MYFVLYNFSEHDNFPPLNLLYYEEAHFGHGGHYQSIQPINQPSSEQVEQLSSEPVSTSNQHVDFGNSTSMIPPSIDSQVIYIIIIYNHH